MDIVKAMEKDAECTLKELKVDGGASGNSLLMQFQADLLGTSVIRPKVTETTALGAAYLAGLAVGYWESIDHIKSQWGVEKEFMPQADEDKVNALKEGWADAIKRTLSVDR
jgi:glycerol kinase